MKYRCSQYPNLTLLFFLAVTQSRGESLPSCVTCPHAPATLVDVIDDYTKQPPRKVYKYNKAMWEHIIEVSTLFDNILAEKHNLKPQKLWDHTGEGLKR